MFYILHGPDTLSIEETVGAMRAQLEESDPMAELNSTELDGRRLTLGELRETAEALPFLGERRLVVVRGLLARCDPGAGAADEREALREGLKALLPALPPTTRLVLIDDKLHGNNPVLRWAKRWRAEQTAQDETAVVRCFEPPKPTQLPRWLQQRATSRDGTIEPAAASALADALTRDGEIDLHLADSELEKLLTYADGRPVTVEDVDQLVTPVSLDSIFRLVDALAERDGPAATNQLHRFLAEGEHPLRLLALIARQLRLLLQTRALVDAGVRGQALSAQLPVPPFVVRKLTGQARRFDLAFLERALARLAELDSQIKTGRIDGALALDLLVAGVCGGAGRSR